MYVKEWSRRRFLALMGGAGMIWLLDACTPKATEKPAGGQDDPLAALQPGQGIVLEQEGKKVAVYKTEAGELIRL
ncbi:MAG: hypothetical protein H5T69_20745, partial [Chloroflexi bacterium]|nr:hypothetical protein [Chloroflexota bacterium]